MYDNVSGRLAHCRTMIWLEWAIADRGNWAGVDSDSPSQVVEWEMALQETCGKALVLSESDIQFFWGVLNTYIDLRRGKFQRFL